MKLEPGALVQHVTNSTYMMVVISVRSPEMGHNNPNATTRWVDAEGQSRSDIFPYSELEPWIDDEDDDADGTDTPSDDGDQDVKPPETAATKEPEKTPEPKPKPASKPRAKAQTKAPAKPKPATSTKA